MSNIEHHALELLNLKMGQSKPTAERIGDNRKSYADLAGIGMITTPEERNVLADHAGATTDALFISLLDGISATSAQTDSKAVISITALHMVHSLLRELSNFETVLANITADAMATEMVKQPAEALDAELRRLRSENAVSSRKAMEEILKALGL